MTRSCAPILSASGSQSAVGLPHRTVQLWRQAVVSAFAFQGTADIYTLRGNKITCTQDVILTLSIRKKNSMAKVALVTGASRGIGRAAALLLARQGYAVGVNYLRDESAARQVVAAIEAQGGKALALQADVVDEAQVMAMFAALDAGLGTLSALVNNAGILFRQANIEQLTAERINQVLSTNVTDYFLCCREAVKRMALRHGGQGGAIVNVSSAASRLGAAGEYVDYAASKGAVDTLTIGLSREVAAQGIRVNGVRPGFIYTEMHASGGEPGRVDRVKDSLPMQRGGQPQEVAEAIAWLLSDAASYVTGTFIEAAGGR